MASPSASRPTTLELTESETRLRDVLLGAAAYIDEGASAEEKSAAQVPEALAKEKIVLRWTGGWVRDKLLGVGSHDVDVAINKLTGENFGLKLLEYLKVPGNDKKHGLEEKESKRIISGLHTIKANPEASKNLETATIKVMGIDLDLVNLRKETYNEVSRNPEMEFGTAEEDAMRRDATVNAMFYNLHTKQVEDFTGRGFDDMAAKIIRTPLEPYQTFKDDPLRVLRLIRFASRLNYTIEPETASAMANKDIQEALKIKIKRERVGVELEKMLKGPDPHMALELIDRFQLYRTIFTDPTREGSSEPEVTYFAPAYNFVKSLLEPSDGTLSDIARLLLRNSDEKYLAWICAAVMPWADAPPAPNTKSSRKPFHAAVLVAQEGFKAPNVVCNAIAASLDSMENIKGLVQGCYKDLRKTSSNTAPGEATARDTLGMAIRRWGPTWRTQVLFSLIHDVVLQQTSKDQLLTQYVTFLKHLQTLQILDADTFKPLLKGTDLASAMALKPGPWMKDALEVVMAWQLRNPSITDPTQAIEEVKKTRKGELTSRLISRFLSLTIRPLFLQTDSSSSSPFPTSSKTSKGVAKTWRDPENAYIVEILRWCLEAASEEDVKREFHLFRVPILQMLDSSELKWKAQACDLIARFVSVAPKDLLSSHGYRKLFAEDLFNLFTYLPSLTPEADSVLVFDRAMPALLTLSTLEEVGDDKMADRIVREAVLAPFFTLSSTSTYPALTTTILSHLPSLLSMLGVSSVAHLPSLLPPLLSILRDPFIPASPQLLVADARALQSLVREAWMRIDVARAVEVATSVCEAWVACVGYGSGEDVEAGKRELKRTVALVEKRVVELDGGTKDVWEGEKARLVGDKSMFAELFEGGEGAGASA